MGARVRSTRSSPAKKIVPTASDTIEMPKSSQTPLRILIASRAISPAARLLSLKHPRDSSHQRFMLCPDNGLFEITKISSPVGEPNSVLFTRSESTEDDRQTNDYKSGISDGFVNTDAEILTATPFDMAFLLLRYLAPESISSKKIMFQPIDDIFEIPTSEERHLRHLFSDCRHMVEQAMTKICDDIDAGDERMFRYSEDKTFRLWVQKAQHVAKQRLPPSMEDRFVTRVLEAPVMSIKREDIQTTAPISDQSSLVSSEGSCDSGSNTDTSMASVVFSDISSASTTAFSTEENSSVDVYALQRLKIALKFISATCLPPALASRLQQRLELQTSPIDFGPLNLELKRISDLRLQAQAQRSVSDFSRKRSNIDGEEAAELKAEKKRKLEEDEKKRRANESRGVRDLKKVNVSGMKKMSDFFTKKPLAAKAKS